MTEQQKLVKAATILRTLGIVIARQLEEVEGLLTPTTPPAQGKKKRRNLKAMRVMEYEKMYAHKLGKIRITEPNEQ